MRYNFYSHSTIGENHKINNLPLQDSISFLNLNGVFSYCLSDGLGSREHSDEGSKVISECVARFLVDNFDSIESGDCETKKGLVDYLYKKAGEYAAIHGYTIESLMGTILAFATDGTKNITIRLGDGKIGVIYDDDGVELLEEKKEGYVNLTMTFMNPNAIEEMEMLVDNDVSIASFATCDGLDCLYENGKLCSELSNAFVGLLSSVIKSDSKDAESLVVESVENIASVELDDDCSLAVLCRSGEPSLASSLKEEEILSVLEEEDVDIEKRDEIIEFAKGLSDELHGAYEMTYLMRHFSVEEETLGMAINLFAKLDALVYNDSIVIFK